MSKLGKTEFFWLLLPVFALTAFGAVAARWHTPSSKPRAEVVDNHIVSFDDGRPARRRLKIALRYIPGDWGDQWRQRNFDCEWVARNYEITDEGAHHYYTPSFNLEYVDRIDNENFVVAFNLSLAEIRQQMRPSTQQIIAKITLVSSDNIELPLKINVFSRRARNSPAPIAPRR